jgi:hypothetical protein
LIAERGFSRGPAKNCKNPPAQARLNPLHCTVIEVGFLHARKKKGRKGEWKSRAGLDV